MMFRVIHVSKQLKFNRFSRQPRAIRGLYRKFGFLINGLVFIAAIVLLSIPATQSEAGPRSGIHFSGKRTVVKSGPVRSRATPKVSVKRHHSGAGLRIHRSGKSVHRYAVRQEPGRWGKRYHRHNQRRWNHEYHANRFDRIVSVYNGPLVIDVPTALFKRRHIIIGTGNSQANELQPHVTGADTAQPRVVYFNEEKCEAGYDCTIRLGTSSSSPKIIVVGDRTRKTSGTPQITYPPIN